jgi:hypothetical protein
MKVKEVTGSRNHGCHNRQARLPRILNSYAFSEGPTGEGLGLSHWKSRIDRHLSLKHSLVLLCGRSKRPRAFEKSLKSDGPYVRLLVGNGIQTER